ncbi:30S ribosomal protein S7 [bacterium]|nr:30S ribosomal protein S7 [bacterium]
MPRKKNSINRKEVLPDYKYGSFMVQKLINQIMWGGKKSVATKIVYDAIAYVAEKSGEDALTAIETAFTNIKPPVEVRSRRVGGATYQVPVEVRPERQDSLCIRWLVNTSRNRKGKTMAAKLGGELLDAYNNTGTVIKKKLDTIKMAEANKAFAHFRW